MDEWMRHCGETNTSLALKVHLKTKRPVSVATIAHLRRGARRFCAPDRARAIEEVLSVKRGDLFVREVTANSQVVSRSA